MRHLAGLGMLLLLGCGPGGEHVPPPDGRVPVLREVTVAPDADAVGGTATGVVVGPQGALLIRPVPGADWALSLHLPDQGWRRIGGIGEGPGEMRMALPLAVTESSAVAWDLATQQLGRWDLAGRWLGAHRVEGSFTPYVVVPDHGVVGSVERREGTVPVRLDTARTSVEDLLPGLDTAYRRVFPRVEGLAARFGNPAVVGHWRGGILLGNGFSYQLLAYDWDGRLRFAFGRELPVNRRTPAQVERQIAGLRASPIGQDEAVIARARRRLASDSSRWFSHLSPPTADARGRIWVVGLDGDQGFADLFAESQFLGRLPLDCPGFEGRWGLHGEWLALVCAPEDPQDDRDAEVRLWRIEG